MMPGQQPIDWDAEGYPELADAIRKDASGAVARGDQADAAVRLARRVPLHPARERLCVRMACTVRSCLAGLHLLRALDLRMALGHRFEPGSAER